MADPHRHPSARPAAAQPECPTPAAAAGTSEAGAWWRQLRAAPPRWLLAAVSLLGVGLALLLFWYARA
jgi:hypothetical protein